MAKKSRQLRLGNLLVGGGAPVVVQSMTNTDTRDWAATLEQIKSLARVGCEVVRVAVPDEEAAEALARIVAKSPMPVIADIHFDYRLALQALDNGVAALRINPGNIGSREKVEAVVQAAKANGAILRIGVNSGSLEKDLLVKYGHPCPEALVESALKQLRFLEKLSFHDVKVSLKSSSVRDSIAAYRLMRQQSDCPLHIGVTEAGTSLRGSIKTSVCAGILLGEGIGDTLRVSLTARPEEEIFVAYEILGALGLRRFGPEIISCPTCGRTEIDLFSLVQAVESRLEGTSARIKVAVMGCVVNGPGEAREADLGIAGGRDKGIIFRKGQVIRSVKGQQALLEAFMEELGKLVA